MRRKVFYLTLIHSILVDNLSDKKKKAGRPRKYASQAERQKAYHERKKEKMEELEEQVKKLVKQQALPLHEQLKAMDALPLKDIINFVWTKITPSEIAVMGTDELESFISTLRRKSKEAMTFEDSFENLVIGFITKYQLETLEDIPKNRIKGLETQISKSLSDIRESIQQETLLYLMEAELASRARMDTKKSKFDLFDQEITTLEKKSE